MRWMIYVLMVTVLFGGCRHAEELATAVAADTPITITTPQTIAAGEPLAVTVALDAPDGTVVTLLLNGSYGPRLYQAAVQAGEAVFALDGSETQNAGRTMLTAAAGAARGQTELTILPGTAVDPVTPLVGARSIIADGAHWAMVITVPHDQFGNPLAEGTLVTFRALHPDGRLETRARPIDHLLAWQRMWSGTLAGVTTVAAEVDGRFGPEKELLEIPGWPQPFSLTVEPGQFIADGRRLLTIRSSVLMDKFGNVMPDGTQVSFVVDGTDGQRVIPAVTLDGVAEAVLQAPDAPQTLTVRGSVFGVSSTPLSISFAPGVQAHSVVVRTRLDTVAGIVQLAAGPLLGPLSQFVPDGTAVHFTITGPDGNVQTLTGVSEAGMVQAVLRLDTLAAGLYRVVVDVSGVWGNGRFTVEEP